MDSSIIIAFLIAIALGALIGTEREMPWSGRVIGGGVGFGGIRSYALLSLMGAFMAWMDMHLQLNIWRILGMIISAIFVVIAYVYTSFRKDRMGVATEYSALITYVIGVVVMQGNYAVAVMLSIFVLIILSSKEYLTKWRERISREEL